ncbi:MAG: hypothetical protein HYZ93_06145 [Candidatus Omnitrophica bacterium]|nr:hypothetical protein [Candidatus Omnitrophota bacterium]
MAAVSIADQLKVLVEMQGLDAQIYRLRREVEAKPAQAARLKVDHQQAAEKLKGAEGQYKALEVKRNQMEMDLGEKESLVRKHQAQLFQVKTNKEYSALQKEIEGLKADKSVLEEEVLKLMEEIDQIKGRIGADREALKAQEAVLQQALAEVDEETRQADASIEQLQSARSTLTPKADPQILRRYERILVNKEGLAIVPVVGEACGGCHMVLPPQMINEIQMATRLIPCESCARILYIEPAA